MIKGLAAAAGLFALLLIGLRLSAAEAPADSNAEHFLSAAYLGSWGEVDAGKSAVTNSANADVRKVGLSMVEDHSRLLEQIKTLAANHKITLPDNLGPHDAAYLSRLKSLKASDFDQEYLSTQIAAHQRAIALFKMEAQEALAGDIKDFATTTLPILESHLKMIQDVHSRLATIRREGVPYATSCGCAGTRYIPNPPEVRYKSEESGPDPRGFQEWEGMDPDGGVMKGSKL